MSVSASCLVPGAEPIPIPFDNRTSGGSSGQPCPLGFYCPNATAEVRAGDGGGYHYICPPTQECLRQRLDLQQWCDAQGSHEPVVCAPGFYCPTWNTREVCPAGSFCPVGSVAPLSCSAFSYCPRGAGKEIFYGSIFALGLIIFLFVPLLLAAVRSRSRFSRNGAAAAYQSGSGSNTSERDLKSGDANILVVMKEKGRTTSTSTNSNNNDDNNSSEDDARLTRSLNTIAQAIRRRRDAVFGANGSGAATGVTVRWENLCVDVEIREQEEEDDGQVELEDQKQKDGAVAVAAAHQEQDADVSGGSNSDAETENGGSAERGDNNNFRAPTSEKALRRLIRRRQKIAAAEMAKKKIESRSKQKREQSHATAPHLRRILQPASGEILPGRGLIILGPSGSSKTTLLKSLLRQNDDNHIVGGTVTLSASPAATTTTTERNVAEAAAVHASPSSPVLSADEARRLVALVPQYDYVHYDLSVYSNVYYSSETRLPASWSAQEKDEHRAAVLHALQLLPHAERIVGLPADMDEGAQQGGLSGGQRKRVSIANELAAAPLVLFGDEVISGLDGTAALRVMTLMATICRATHVPCICVLHQPRIEIFRLFDDVMLMAPGGNVAYHGPRDDAIRFFQDHDVLTSAVVASMNAVNPADLLVDLVIEFPDQCVAAWQKFGPEFLKRKVEEDEENNDCCNSKNNNNKATPSASSSLQQEQKPLSPVAKRRLSTMPDEDDVAAKHERQQQQQPQQSESQPQSAVVSSSPAASAAAAAPVAAQQEEQLLLLDDRISVFHETFLMAERKLLKYASENYAKTLIFDVLITGVSSAVVTSSVVGKQWGGPLISPYTLSSTRWNIELVFMGTMLLFIGIAACTGPASVRIFGNDLKQLQREFRCGHRVTATFVGFCLVEVSRMIVLSLLFSTVSYLMWQPVMQFHELFGILLTVTLTYMFIGAAVGVVVPPLNSRLISLIVAVFLSLLNGFPNIPFLYFGAQQYWLTVLAMMHEWEPQQRAISWTSVYDSFDMYPETLNSTTRSIALAVSLIELFLSAGLCFMALWWMSKK